MPPEPPGSALRRFIEALLRWQVVVIAALLLALVVAAKMALGLQFDLSFQSFLSEGRRQANRQRSVEQPFANNGASSLVAVLEGPDVLSPTALAAIERMSDAVATIPHVDRVLSLATVPIVHGSDGSVVSVPARRLLETGMAPATVRTSLLGSPLYVNRLISADATTTAVMALLDETHQGLAARAPTIAAFRAAVEHDLPPGFRVSYTGYPIAEAENARLVWRGFLIAEIVAVLIMGAVLYASFRDPIGVILPLAVVGVATVLTLGFMAWERQDITFTTASVPLLILVIGVGEVAFFLTRFEEERVLGGSRHEIVVRTALGVIPPGLIASAMTSVAFASLLTGRIPITRDLGFDIAFGGLAVFGAALLIAPIVLSWVPLRPSGPPTGFGLMDRLMAWVCALVRRRHPAIGITATVFSAVALLGAARVIVSQYATAELPPTNPVRTAQDVVDARLGGTFETRLVVHARDGGSVLRPDVLGQVVRVQEFLSAQPHVSKTWSVTDHLAELHVAFNDGDPTFRHLPETEALAAQYLLIASGSPGDLDDLIDADRRTLVIGIGTDDLGTAELLALHARTQQFLGTLPGTPLTGEFTGDYWAVSLGVDGIVRDLFVGTLTSFVSVFALVGLFLRSWKLTLLSIPPNLLPLLAALLVMGFGGLDLRIGTSILLPTTLGTVVDSTVHFLARVREEWLEGHGYDAAVTRALSGVGPAIIYSSGALILGFLCFLIPEFLVFQHIALIAAAMLAVAMLANLFVAPSVVLWGRPFGPER